jgi:hypothetical protein
MRIDRLRARIFALALALVFGRGTIASACDPDERLNLEFAIADDNRAVARLEQSLDDYQAKDTQAFILDGKTDRRLDALLGTTLAELNGASPSKSGPAETSLLDTSKMTDPPANQDTFQDQSGNRMLLKAPADYHWIAMYGRFPSRYLAVECPIRTSAGATTYTYDCNFTRKDYESAKPSPTVIATSQGRAHVQLPLVQFHKNSAVMTFEAAPVQDLTKTPPATAASHAGSVTWNEISQ